MEMMKMIRKTKEITEALTDVVENFYQITQDKVIDFSAAKNRWKVMQHIVNSMDANKDQDVEYNIFEKKNGKWQ